MFYPTSASFKTENIVKCKNCSLIFTNPRLKSDLLLKFYSEGRDIDYIKQQQERTQVFRNVIKYIESFCPGGRMLDIGCGAGFLLSAAAAKGWDAKGIELNKFFADFARERLKINVIGETAEKVDLEPDYFDVITMWDSLEHLLDPYLVLSKAHRWLKKGGYIFINTPDINSILAKIFKSKWWFIESMHLYYFNPQMINMYFKKIGFEYLQKKSHIQTLKLCYLASKIKPYSKPAYKTINAVIRFMRLADLNISYYAGQIIVIGRK
ncbi:MAG: class I SAM-dependent methyltransferase [Candidatus Omnitrophota bacterium]